MTTKNQQDSLTPLMQQYQNIKQNYRDAIVFFRLGDFYEMFGDDAVKSSPILDIVLTKRQNLPMCGVPHHSVSTYLSKLIKKGYKVAVCEQLEDPSAAKGVVKRDVVRLITPGTLIEENILDTRKNNYLLAISPRLIENEKDKKGENKCQFGIAYLDISTGEFFMTEITDDEYLTRLACELSRINASEYIIPEAFRDSSINKTLSKFNMTANFAGDWIFEYGNATAKIAEMYNLTTLKSLGITDKTLGLGACNAILNYLENTQKNKIPPLRPIRYYSTDEFMLLDEAAVKTLELVEGSASGNEKNSLLEILDQTSTPMGSRLMRRFLLQPLTNADRIKARQETVKYFIDNGVLRRKTGETLKQVSDLDRILSRLSAGLANPRDLVSLKETLKLIPGIKSIINASFEAAGHKPAILEDRMKNLPEMPGIIELISNTIVDSPHIDTTKPGFIKKGCNTELDELRLISQNGKSYMVELEQKEKSRTGISSLKVGYTSVFGYYIEVSKANLPNVPADYIRKQTLVNCERYITEELKKYEEKVLTAEEKIIRLEQGIFEGVQKEILKNSNELHDASSILAETDVYQTLAKNAEENNYCLPVIDYGYKLEIKDGRHPVIEKKLQGKTFVPNDTLLDGCASQIIILTGPNMAGKSTYLRQVALTTIMAQIGSYVSAKEAAIGIVDKIFTRIGSADNLIAGESTFMVEMHETANIMHNATPRSLLILDEVGRGTSTFDGISIAWACVEYLSGIKNENKTGPKVLFATHYFELTELGGKLEGVKNYNVAVREWKDDIIFLYKILEGCSDRSYGIHVAKLAGLPAAVIDRAKEVLNELDRKSQAESYTLAGQKDRQLEFFVEKYHPIEDELARIDTDNITPIKALEILFSWKERFNGKK